jgi:hypothetical protein
MLTFAMMVRISDTVASNGSHDAELGKLRSDMIF